MLHCVGQKRQVALQLVTFAIRQTVGMAGISNQRDDVGNAGAQSLRRWAMANHLRAELVLDAMEMAVGQRPPKDVIHHSDQGSQGGINWSSQHNRDEWCDDRVNTVSAHRWPPAN